MQMTSKKWTVVAVVAVLCVLGYLAWSKLTADTLPEGIASSNGRIEATEIDIAAKTGGRLEDIMVREGDFVTAGQVVAQMDINQLEAQMRQAQAELRRSRIGIDTAKSLVTQREAEKQSAQAVIEQREAELDSAQNKLGRSQQLIKNNTVSQQTLEDDETAQRTAKAALANAKASLAASEAAIGSARMQVIDAEAAVEAAKAAIESLQADIEDSTLIAPRDGRIQYRVAEPGEVIASGGRVLNMLDLSDTYMTFFLPTAQAGRLAIGSDVRLVLDAAPQYIIPAKVSFVSDVAQFTPKTVETEEERLKLMFRVRAQISKDLLQRYIEQVKTGLPGTAYVKVNSDAEWPDFLTTNLVQ